MSRKQKQKKVSKHSPRARTTGKKSIRGRYPALNPAKNLKIRQEMLEGMDYTKDLSEKEKAWLDKFMDGYNNANVRMNENHPVFKRKKDKSICHAINNARNKDAYSITKSKNFLMYDTTPDYWAHVDEKTNSNSHEDVTVGLVDIQMTKEKVQKESEAFIAEVKHVQKTIPQMVRDLKAASSMVKIMLDNAAEGELSPEGVEVNLNEATESLLQIQGDEKDVAYDTTVLREQLVEYTKPVQKKKKRPHSTKKRKY